MSADNMFDILMEIRKVDKRISETKLEVQKSQHDFIIQEKRLYHIKELQSKAEKVCYEMERKMEIIELEMKEVHKNYDGTLELLKEHIEIEDGSEKKEIMLTIEDLKKHIILLKQKLITAESAKDKLVEKLSDVQIQICIQKKRSAATQIRLQKCLQELMQDEKKLEEELKSLSNN